MSALLLPETGLPGFAPLLRGPLWKRWAREGLVPNGSLPHVHYLRLKPQVSCRLVLGTERRLDSEDAPELFYVTLFPSVERAQVFFDKLQDRVDEHASTRAASLCVDSAAVILPFPTDPAIRSLADVWDGRKLRRWLADGDQESPPEAWRIKTRGLRVRLLGYKPERRAVFRVDASLRHRTTDEKRQRTYHLKVGTASALQRSLHFAREVRAAEGVQLTSPALGWSPASGVLVTPWTSGPLMSHVLDDPHHAESRREAGRRLAQLHRCTFNLEHRPSPVEEQQAVSAMTSDLTALHPTRGDAFERLRRTLHQRLGDFAAEPSAVVHGDFHPGQIVLSTDGPRFVDFDESGLGYGLLDLGDFAAQADEVNPLSASFGDVLDGYQEVAGIVDRPLLNTARALGRFRRLMVPFRRLDADWPDAIDARLDHCAKDLEDAS